jgi:NADPH:quinone reductase-like Zn-dependent oxidoreductase
VNVRAAAVNPLDWHFIRGEPAIMRMSGKPKARIPGADVSGTVVGVGPNVTRFRAGDQVFGSCRGAFAEFVCCHADRCAAKPARLTFEQAAALPVAGVTALRALRNYAAVRPGQSVLVNGAAGGVGTFAVQIAKTLGAEVTGVCSARNVELVRSLGADHVIDYTAEDFTRQARRYDLILNVAGKAKVPDTRRALSPNGTLVVVGGGVGRDLDNGITVGVMLALAFVALASRFGRQRVSMLVGKEIKSDELEQLAKLAETGKLRSVIDRSYLLAAAAEAVRYLEAGHARGKVVVTPPQA